MRVPSSESLPTSLDLRIDERLSKLRLDLAAEMSEELRKLKLYVSERFHNIEQRTHHATSTDPMISMRTAQQKHEQCLRGEIELNMMRIRDELLPHKPKPIVREEIRSNYEGTGNTVSRIKYIFNQFTMHCPCSDLLRSKSHASLLSLHETDSCYESSISGNCIVPSLFLCDEIKFRFS